MFKFFYSRSLGSVKSWSCQCRVMKVVWDMTKECRIRHSLIWLWCVMIGTVWFMLLLNAYRCRIWLGKIELPASPSKHTPWNWSSHNWLQCDGEGSRLVRYKSAVTQNSKQIWQPLLSLYRCLLPIVVCGVWNSNGGNCLTLFGYATSHHPLYFISE